MTRLVTINEEDCVLNMDGFGRVTFTRFVSFGHTRNYLVSLYSELLRECTSASAAMIEDGSLKRIPILIQTAGENFPVGG